MDLPRRRGIAAHVCQLVRKYSTSDIDAIAAIDATEARRSTGCSSAGLLRAQRSPEAPSQSLSTASSLRWYSMPLRRARHERILTPVPSPLFVSARLLTVALRRFMLRYSMTPEDEDEDDSEGEEEEEVSQTKNKKKAATASGREKEARAAPAAAAAPAAPAAAPAPASMRAEPTAASADEADDEDEAAVEAEAVLSRRSVNKKKSRKVVD